MKSVSILALTACTVLFSSCDKFGYSAQYKYDVSDEYGTTRAILHGHDDSGPDITWEEGDMIEFTVKVMKDERTLNKEEGKLVYENGSWVTYKAYGSSFTKVDHISVHASTLDCSVRIRFSCTNGDIKTADPNCFTSTWVRTVPFEEGLQTILVTLPF